MSHRSHPPHTEVLEAAPTILRIARTDDLNRRYFDDTAGPRRPPRRNSPNSNREWPNRPVELHRQYAVAQHPPHVMLETATGLPRPIRKSVYSSPPQRGSTIAGGAARPPDGEPATSALAQVTGRRGRCGRCCEQAENSCPAIAEMGSEDDQATLCLRHLTLARGSRGSRTVPVFRRAYTSP